MSKYLFIAFIFFACNNPSEKREITVSSEPLDTIQTKPEKIIATPALFETAFIKGTTQDINGKTLTLYGITIGKLKITSGHIVACDPLHIDEYGKPYTQTFPTGEFPVQLSIAKLDNQETTAFARIQFSEKPVVKWEFALLEGQSQLPFEGEEIHGYAVDAGVGILMDEEVSKALNKDKSVHLESDLFKEMKKHNHYKWKYTMYNFGNYNAAAFSTGLGDGRYATYIGFDAEGKPCRLLSDFHIFEWRKNVQQ